MAGPPARSSDLPVRVLSALVMLAIVAVELILGGIWFLAFIIAVGAGLALLLCTRPDEPVPEAAAGARAP